MQYAVLGQTGVRVSRICLGTATLGVAPTGQDADRVVGAALDLGINFVDTADVYGNAPVFDRPGASPAIDREPAEQILGRALRGPQLRTRRKARPPQAHGHLPRRRTEPTPLKGNRLFCCAACPEVAPRREGAGPYRVAICGSFRPGKRHQRTSRRAHAARRPATR